MLIRDRSRSAGRVVSRRKRRARLALLKAGHWGRAQQHAILTDGRDRYEVLERQERSFGGGTWLRLENVDFRGNAKWFRLDDCGELAVEL